jgi:pimeloyl-ACP methyl ester carboxylesterase
MKGSRWVVIVGAALGAAAVAGRTWPRYHRDMAAARQRLQGRSRIAQTALGPIEFAERGDGPPVLVVHGAAGGFDQGLLLAEALGDGYRLIAPSRFGYLRTPMPSECGPVAQADAHAALLDALRIQRVVVAGASAGALSTLQFALRHPKRCVALVLVSAVTDAILARSVALDAVVRLATASDFLYWLALQRGEWVRLWSFGLSARVVASLAPADRGWLDAFTETTLPLSLRRPGVLQDLTCCVRPEAPPLEQVAVPALVIHTVDDRLVPVSTAVTAARRIPGARLVLLPSGGHLLLGQHPRARFEVMDFLEIHSGLE